MIGVMETAIKLDDSYVQKEIELFSRLTTENQVCIIGVHYVRLLLIFIFEKFILGIERTVGYSKSQWLIKELSSWHQK